VRYEQNSSIIFVGEFPSVFIDERELFDGQVDSKSVVKVGPVVQCTFAGGQHEFLSTPDRVSIRSFSEAIMPDDLVETAKLIASKMDTLAAALKTSDMGFNFDGAIRQSAFGKSGIDFCRDLVTNEVTRIAGTNDFIPKHAIAFNKGGGGDLQYNVRIEPHAGSRGEDLFFAINGHQNVNSGVRLLDKLNCCREFIKHTQGLLNRLENKAVS